MAFTKIQIISRASNILGKGTVTSLSADAFTSAMSEAFDLLLAADLEGGSWRFACDIVQLSQLALTPVSNQWRYIYQLPGDFLKLIRLYPQNWDFEIYKDGHLYSNMGNALFLEYVRNVDITAMPAYFVKYLCYELAGWFAASNAQNSQLTSYIDSKTEIYRGQALAWDAQNRPQTPLVSAPVIDLRYQSTTLIGG